MDETDYETEAQASDGSAVSSDLDRKLKAWYREDHKAVAAWRKEAREDFEFYNGDQWSEDDKRTLMAQMRPALTFNRVAPLVNAVVGAEINNRREVRYIPREQGDAKANEVLTAAGEWFRDECAAEDEESDAFQDTTIAGMGWTDTRLDFDEEPDGSPLVERMDALEMGWDCKAVKPNLTDARRLWRTREISFEEAEKLTGVSDRRKLNAAWVKSASSYSKEQHDQDEADLYTGEQDEQANGGYETKRCILVEARWFEDETYYRGPDLETGKPKEYTIEQIRVLKKAYPDFQYVKQTRKSLRRVFIGSEVLGEPDKGKSAPMVPTGTFGWECITGYRDKVKGTFYGIVRAAKDPQRWSNKFFSQVQYLLNSQSKGGIAAERGAFEDDRQAEESWAKQDGITWLKTGAISGDKPKIQPKPAAQFPAGFWALFQEAKDEISQVTGLSPEFIGTREVDQAGVLEYQRRQSSLNLLASLFNSLRRYRKRQGRIMLYLIQEHLADGRLVRIVGDSLKQYVPLMKAEGIAKAKAEAMQKAPEAIAMLVQQGMDPRQAQAKVIGEIKAKFDAMEPVDGQYDIIVDDSPSSPNEKDRTWQILTQMLPFVRDMLTPDMALEILALSPLPASLVEDLKRKAAEAAAQPKPPSPEEMEAKRDQERHVMDMQGKAVDQQFKREGQQMDMQAKGIDLYIAQQKAELQQTVDLTKAQVDMGRLAVQAQANATARRNAGSRTSA